jgi:hypothetical protein
LQAPGHDFFHALRKLITAQHFEHSDEALGRMAAEARGGTLPLVLSGIGDTFLPAWDRTRCLGVRALWGVASWNLKKSQNLAP